MLKKNGLTIVWSMSSVTYIAVVLLTYANNCYINYLKKNRPFI